MTERPPALSRLPRPFNSPLELGLRMLFLLDAGKGHFVDLQRLVSYDYLLVHSGDVAEGPASLHPAVPFRGGELLVKRDLVRAGLDQMFSRELLQKTFTSSGIVYRSTTLTTAFIELLQSRYAGELRSRAYWLIERFGSMSDAALTLFISENIGRWGAEFDHFSAIGELDL